MADDITFKRVKPNPSTGTISGDVSKFVLNPLKNLFKDKDKKREEEVIEQIATEKGEDKSVYDVKEVVLNQGEINELVKLAVAEDREPADTIKLKNKFEKDKQTSPWVDYLSFATGGPTGVLLNKDVKTKIADKLVAENPNVKKRS